MSVIPKSRLPMRIIALPLTGAVRGPRHTDNPSPLVYYHFQMRPKEEKRQVGWVDWATSKAASVWAQQFGKAPENSWKVCRSILSNASLCAERARRHSSNYLRMARGWPIALISRSWHSKAWTPHWVPKYRTEVAQVSLRAKRKLYVYSSPSIWIITSEHHSTRIRSRLSIPQLLARRHWLT